MYTYTGRDLLPHLRQIFTDTPGFLRQAAQTHGDLVAFKVGGIQVYLVNHPDAIRRVLQDNHRNYSKDTIQYNTLAAVTGRGLLTSDGDQWFRNRRLEQPAFSRPRLANLDEIIHPALTAMLSRWSEQAGAVLDIDREMMAVTLEIVGKALFSFDLRTQAPRLTAAVLTALDHVIYKAQKMITPPDWVPTAHNLAFKRALRELDAAVFEVLVERRRQGSAGGDLLDMLLAARDEETGLGLSDAQLRDEIITLLIAGHETVASALTWSFYLLAQHPQQQAQLEQEADSLGGRLPGYADLDALPFAQQVFSEALRLYPPAWLITRKAIGADTLCAETIPAGALLVISPYVIHRHPEYWPQADQFVPERFAEAERSWPRYAYVPFGGGPRLCIGNHFAQIEAVQILAAVTQRFHLSLESDQTILADPLVTLRPRGGMPMRISLR